ncbi:glycosyl hydrolase [Streptomyces sp. NPDC059118]|uniref:glycosyl hydrolase n=1 Tax=unclassified Streptomyces TaxID=2593676 RepID=UPI0036B34B1C
MQSTGLRLGAPAVATGADTADGWLDQFLRGATTRGLRADFLPIHWCGADFNAKNQLHGYLQATYDRPHKPLWHTEYVLSLTLSGILVLP